MKAKITYIALLATLAGAFTGCRQNELFYYDENYSALNIWMGQKSYPTDSVTFNFAYTVLERDSLLFWARLTGKPADHDRTFRLKAVEGDVDKVQLYLPDYVLKAGEYEGEYAIYIDKPEGYSEFTDKAGSVTLKMEENSFFEEGAIETNTLKIVFKNFLSKPDDWDDAVYPYMPLSKYFGAYSDVKYAFMIQNTGYSNFSIYFSMSEDNIPDGCITYTLATRLKQKCKLALAEYNNSHDEPLCDEYGIPISFPS